MSSQKLKKGFYSLLVVDRLGLMDSSNLITFSLYQIVEAINEFGFLLTKNVFGEKEIVLLKDSLILKGKSKKSVFTEIHFQSSKNRIVYQNQQESSRITKIQPEMKNCRRARSQNIESSYKALWDIRYKCVSRCLFKFCRRVY